MRRPCPHDAASRHRAPENVIRTERHEELTAALVEEITALLDGCGQGGEALGEAKRAQLVPGAGRWSGVLVREDGVLVAYAHLRWGSGDTERATAEIVVAPARGDRAALARALLAEVRGIVSERGGGTLLVWAHRLRDPADSLPAIAGMPVQRILAVMARELRPRPEPAEGPEGVELRRYRPEVDDAELLRVNNAAFEGHPEQGAWDTEVLVDRRQRPWFDPGDVILAWRGGRLMGFHWTKVHQGDDGPGEVYVLGVGPEAQGLGLGRVLLDAGLAHLHDRGCRHVILYVDTANSGAVRLYEAAGFRTRHLEVCYAQDVAPARGH